MSRLLAFKTMRMKTKHKFKYAVCINNSGFPVCLQIHKLYRVLPDADVLNHGLLRVIDNSGEDYLFERERFVLVELPLSLKRSFAQLSALPI